MSTELHRFSQGCSVSGKRSISLASVSKLIRIHVDDPFALQFFLNTMKIMVAPEDAARQLAATNPVYAAVCNVTNFTAHLDAPVYTIARWPQTGEAFVTVLGNRRP